MKFNLNFKIMFLMTANFIHSIELVVLPRNDREPLSRVVVFYHND